MPIKEKNLLNKNKIKIMKNNKIKKKKIFLNNLFFIALRSNNLLSYWRFFIAKKLYLITSIEYKQYIKRLKYINWTN